MKFKFARNLLMAAGLVATVATAQDNTAPSAPPPPPPATLHVGDPAPAMRFGAWLKGEPFDRFAPGKVYVMEFWATWCGPCRAAMPHLSALAKKYAGKAVFTGVNVWETVKTPDKEDKASYMPKVEDFVKSANDMMAYNVAVDTESAVNKGAFGVDWLAAAGIRGIPSTFVIGKDGRIAWIGHPSLGLDEVVGLAIEDKLDATVAAEISTRYKAMAAESMELRKQLGAIQKTGDAERTVAFADEIMAKIPFVADTAIPAKYAALASLDQTRARAYAEEIIRTRGNAPYFLRSLAMKALEETNPNRDYPLAVKLMEAAMRSSTPTDIAAAPVMAEAYFKTGNTAKAVAMQQAVIAAMKEENNKQYESYLKTQERALEKYQAAMAGKTEASAP